MLKSELMQTMVNILWEVDKRHPKYVWKGTFRIERDSAIIEIKSVNTHDMAMG